jgi:hypothetical protein
MDPHRIANVPAPGRAGKVPLWVLVAAFFAGLTLLTLLSPSPAHAQASADSTVLLQWTAPGDDGNVGRATSYDIRYRTTNISGTDTTTWWNGATQVTGEPVPRTAGSVDSMRVRGLTPLTTFYFMIRAADEIPNWSGFSNLAVKTTGGDSTPPSAVADLAVTGSTGTSLALRWTAPGDDGSTGTASSYDIRYSTAPITTTNWNSATQATGEPAPLAGGTVQTYTLNGLSGSQTYYVAVRATDDRGNMGALSNVPSGTTADTVPPAPVRDLSYYQDPSAPIGVPVAAIGGERREEGYAS